MKHLLIVIVTSLVTGPTLAKDFSQSTPELIKMGESAYKMNCLSCHGDKLDGKGPAGQYLKPLPRDLIKGAYVKGDSAKEVFDTLTKGLPGTAMVPFSSLSEEKRWAIVHYLRSLRK